MRSAALTRPTPSWPRHAISRRLPSSRQPSWSSASATLSVTERTAPGAGPIAEPPSFISSPTPGLCSGTKEPLAVLVTTLCRRRQGRPWRE